MTIKAIGGHHPRHLELRPLWLPDQLGAPPGSATAGVTGDAGEEATENRSVAALALAPGGTSAIAVLSDTTCWHWLPDGTHRQLAMRAHAVHDAGAELFFVQPDGLTRWSSATLSPISTLPLPFVPNRTIRGKRFSVVETTEGELFRIHLDTGEIQALPWLFAAEDAQPLLSFCCDDDGRWLAAVHPNHVRLWELASPMLATQPLGSFAVSRPYLGFAAWYGERLLISGVASGWAVADPNAAKIIANWPEPFEPLLDLGPDAAGGPARVLAATKGQRLVAVERDSARALHAFDEAPFERLELSSDQHHVVGWQDGELSVWQSASGRLVGRWSQEQRIRNARMSGATVAFGTQTGEVIFLSAGQR